MVVYLITNKQNGKGYVGQTIKTLAKRWSAHISVDSPCRYLRNAIQKYGISNFEIRPIVVVGTKEWLDYYEKEFIKLFRTKFPNGYNLTDGGEGQCGRFTSEETRKKMSIAHMGNTNMRGKAMPLEAVTKLVERNKGNTYNKGKKYSSVSKARLSAAMIGNTNGARVNHNRWHVSRGICNPKCRFCQESNI
jgi:group I intron endonuclease